jgi:pterin-4a-carbinolamine dehydratase
MLTTVRTVSRWRASLLRTRFRTSSSATRYKSGDISTLHRQPYLSSTGNGIRKFSPGSSNKPRYDPSARRPNQKCDPYGQGGEPLSRTEAEGLKVTVHDDWNLEYKDDGGDVPQNLTREFLHPDYLSGARALHKIAAVAQIHNHFPPLLALERRIVRKNWQVVSRVQCRTSVLGGLSRHDFHLAMVGCCKHSRSTQYLRSISLCFECGCIRMLCYLHLCSIFCR